ncbi:thioredoxin-like 1-1, chloroplastic [Diospyros lotus]|uniref:thioredoxin-like 1-1, chloroplastic n=1 Tax=Diospyros lotus TaxID=55363 RepID=UPI002257A9AA|nr:thioredoxin-like 1-1, chloroplastic [Diospyros lotus]
MLLSPSSSSSSSASIHRRRGGGSVLQRKSAVFSSRIGAFPSPRLVRKVSLRSLSLSSSFSSSASGFHGRRFLGLQGELESNRKTGPSSSSFSINSQLISGVIGKSLKWWEKGLQPNMREVKGAQELVDSLLNAGDKLVVVDFFSPGCGGCRALHPKICQLAEMNPDVQFLQVNYEEHKSMCYTLNVHVLPFFRFYRGAHGRLCSFSCTNATIKKFKDALAKHSPDRCSLAPIKGLEEKELLALAANKDLSFTYTPKPKQPDLLPAREEAVTESERAPVHAIHFEAEHPVLLPLPSRRSSTAAQETLVASGR